MRHKLSTWPVTCLSVFRAAPLWPHYLPWMPQWQAMCCGACFPFASKREADVTGNWLVTCRKLTNFRETSERHFVANIYFSVSFLLILIMHYLTWRELDLQCPRIKGCLAHSKENNTINSSSPWGKHAAAQKNICHKRRKTPPACWWRGVNDFMWQSDQLPCTADLATESPVSACLEVIMNTAASPEVGSLHLEMHRGQGWEVEGGIRRCSARRLVCVTLSVPGRILGISHLLLHRLVQFHHEVSMLLWPSQLDSSGHRLRRLWGLLSYLASQLVELTVNPTPMTKPMIWWCQIFTHVMGSM